MTGADKEQLSGNAPGPCHDRTDARDDLIVKDSKTDTGLDFHVYIDREDKPMRLMFGILLRSVPSPVTVDQANKLLGPSLGQFRGMRRFTYPVCLFFFTMREEQAYFTWLAEPILTDGAPNSSITTRRAARH